MNWRDKKWQAARDRAVPYTGQPVINMRDDKLLCDEELEQEVRELALNGLTLDEVFYFVAEPMLNDHEFNMAEYLGEYFPEGDDLLSVPFAEIDAVVNAWIEKHKEAFGWTDSDTPILPETLPMDDETRARFAANAKEQE